MQYTFTRTFFFSHDSVMADDSPGELYIRSVCFSPNGKYLATGAEDKQIRVRFSSPFRLLFARFSIQQLRTGTLPKKHIRNVFDGRQQEIYSLDFSEDGRVLVSGSGDKTARIWDMIDGIQRINHQRRGFS